MHFKHILTMSVTSLIVASMGFGASELTPTQAMDQIRKDHPEINDSATIWASTQNT